MPANPAHSDINAIDIGEDEAVDDPDRARRHG
jgi:hypothetical protein